MGFKEGNKYHEYDSMFMGAIFMANKETKLECLKRKLFGLPLSKASFMKQIKAGMLLFLFEHEERKLYGVFEATSDGALNIIPNAYISSGKSFPAQVLFKRLWMCKPLLEEEFRDAIKENYYTHNKFNFGLSYEQVFKLIHLFSLKRIRLNLHQKQERPNNIITEFEMSGGDKGQVTGEASYLEASLREHSTNDCVDLKKYTGLSISTTNYPSYEKHFTTGQSSLGSIGRESYQMAPLGIERRSSFLGHPTFPSDPSMRSNFPRFGGKVPSDTLGGMEGPPLPQKNNTWIPSSMEIRNPHSSSEIHPCYTDPNDYKYSSHNYWPSPYPVSKTSNVRFPSVGLEGQPNPGKHSTSERYDPSNPRIPFSRLGNAVDMRMDSLPSMCDPSNVEGHPAATQSQFDSRGQQCWDLVPSSDYIPLPRDSGSNRNSLSFHLNSPQRNLSDRSYSESEEDDDYDELRPYPPTHANQYRLSGTNSRLHSDAEQGRTSVFSRLSKASERRKKHEYRQQDSRVTLDQLVELVSRRREEIIKAQDQSTICNDDKQSGSIVMTEPNTADFLDDMLNSSCDAVDEESIEVPFMKFKRRSEIRKTAGEMETNAYVDSGENEEVLGRNKRRKLVRPSLNDECQTLNGTFAAAVEVQPLVEVGEKIAEKVVYSSDPNPGCLANIITDAEKICEKDVEVQPLVEVGEKIAEKVVCSSDPNPGCLANIITDAEKICEKDVEVQPLVEVGEKIAEKVVYSSDPNPGCLANIITDAEKICEKDELLLREKGEPFPDPNPGYLTSSITNGEKIGEKGESSLEHPGCLRSTTTTENVTEASRDCVKVSNRNLRFFLQKIT